MKEAALNSDNGSSVQLTDRNNCQAGITWNIHNSRTRSLFTGTLMCTLINTSIHPPTVTLRTRTDRGGSSTGGGNVSPTISWGHITHFCSCLQLPVSITGCNTILLIILKWNTHNNGGDKFLSYWLISVTQNKQINWSLHIVGTRQLTGGTTSPTTPPPVNLVTN